MRNVAMFYFRAPLNELICSHAIKQPRQQFKRHAWVLS